MPSLRIPALAFVAAFAANYAHADAAREVLLEIAKCADIADSAERLKCFDAAVPRAKSALALPPAEVKERAGSVEAFGLPQSDKPVTKAEDFGKPPVPVDEPKPITEITAGILEFAKTPRGKALFVLDNGQVWKQLDADGTDVLAPPSGVATKVTIEIGVFGSYNLTIEGRNGLLKVSRLK